ncbi:hypothetical protein MYX88_002014 [Salmonella enterica]|nr:hypothetical protein [Salmonella enterica]
MHDRLPDIRLPVWMNRGNVVCLKNTLMNVWRRVYGWLAWPLSQTDPLTCDIRILNMLAWQYDITRFNGEPLALYRKRVKYAFINARDAGSVAGFKAIFKRLDIGYVEIHERTPGVDWDVILLHITDGQLAGNSELLTQIIRQYGRTCRRYRIQIVIPTTLIIGHGFTHGSWQCFYTEEPDNGTDRYHFSL